jgi:hypothetical protein
MNDNKVTAWVSMHDGKRLGWKCLKGVFESNPMDWKYFGLGPRRPPRSECTVERMVFDDWKAAATWCASFPAHPAEGGARPDAPPIVVNGDVIKLGAAVAAKE